MKDSERQSIIKVVGQLVRDITGEQRAALESLTLRCERLEAREASARDGRDGKDGRNGIDGRDGKDVYEMTILEGFDPDKNYHLGTLAAKDGGLWRYTADGWRVLIDGVKNIVSSVDEERTVMLGVETTAGKVDGATVRVPGIEYQGVWKKGPYTAGQVVTHDGSMWIALQATEEKPGEYGKQWQLCVKRGRNGKSV